ncbi:cupin domain-containing protein [Nostoc sp. 106C]|uniref:cupin domain-containing protein n=1 Tax=Nostoc sp. 106C TaxID=1932667 RepID=UPI000A3A8F8A|nr:cupin domain-containing protein [Nostoc sp. 106C]OUL19651.1 cupin [Nostoc sp. 106C]OUL27870.1 cupin [Nostoc sp. RF31YmG]
MINKETAEHYLWGNNCHGWHLVKQLGLSVIQEIMPPGTTEVRHYHQLSRQFFFILSGTATLEIDGSRQILSQHQGVEVTPNIPHQMLNESDRDLEFLVISQPPSHGDRMLLS